jgi:hypothetical protein
VLGRIRAKFGKICDFFDDVSAKGIRFDTAGAEGSDAIS